jgi:hypothetical protein
LLRLAKRTRRGHKPRAVLIDPQLDAVIEDVRKRLGTSIQGATNILICLGGNRPELIPDEYRDRLPTTSV